MPSLPATLDVTVEFLHVAILATNSTLRSMPTEYTWLAWAFLAVQMGPTLASKVFREGGGSPAWREGDGPMGRA